MVIWNLALMAVAAAGGWRLDDVASLGDIGTAQARVRRKSRKTVHRRGAVDMSDATAPVERRVF